MNLKLMTVSLAAILASAPAVAADTTANASGGVDILESWNYDPLYRDGRSVNDLVYGADLVGPGGDTIGSVENLVFSDDGQVMALIAEVGGFWDIGDTHVSVPWDEVHLGTDTVRVPVTEESYSDYSGAYDGYLSQLDTDEEKVVDDDLQTGPGMFKATDLIGDYATLSDESPYGYVRDLLIGDDGNISAVIVEANAYGSAGYYAYPYGGHGSPADPNSPNCGMPYDRNQIDRIEQFDYDKLKITPS